MTMPKAKRRIVNVDGKSYEVSVSPGSIDREQNVSLRISIRAQFGSQGFCVVRGLTNRSFWHDYPNTEEMQAASISVGPLQLCGLITLAHSQGWDPTTSKSTFELNATRDTIRQLGDE